jgi:hypothetical protein
MHFNLGLTVGIQVLLHVCVICACISRVGKDDCACCFEHFYERTCCVFLRLFGASAMFACTVCLMKPEHVRMCQGCASPASTERTDRIAAHKLTSKRHALYAPHTTRGLVAGGWWLVASLL